MRALLVDDDRELGRLLRDYFVPHGVTLTHVLDGDSAMGVLASSPESAVDVILLDVMLPGLDGFEVCRRIRERFDVPIVMLTARGDDSDRITGLDTGADDYVPKPFNPRELLARVHAVTRRARPTRKDFERIAVGDLVVDVPGHTVSRAGREVGLTAFEFRVLAFLAQRAGITVTREELAAAVLASPEGYDPAVDRSLDVHVSHLRQKLGDGGREPRLIRTVRGVGYVLVKRS